MPNLNHGFLLAMAVILPAPATTWHDICEYDKGGMNTTANGQTSNGTDTELVGTFRVRCTDSVTDETGTYTVSDGCDIPWVGSAGCSNTMAEYVPTSAITTTGKYCYCTMRILNGEVFIPSANHRWYIVAGNGTSNNSDCLRLCSYYCAMAFTTGTDISGHMDSFWRYFINLAEKQEI